MKSDEEIFVGSPSRPYYISNMLKLMDIERVIPKLGEVFLAANQPMSHEATQYRNGLFVRIQVVHVHVSPGLLYLQRPQGGGGGHV